MSGKKTAAHTETIDPEVETAPVVPQIKGTKPAAAVGDGKQIITGEDVLKILRDKGTRI